MTNREVFFKSLYYSKEKIAKIRYFYKNKNGIVHTDGILFSFFSTTEEIVLKNIERMEQIEKKEGFFCWAISPEGKKFLKDNNIVLGEDIVSYLTR